MRLSTHSRRLVLALFAPHRSLPWRLLVAAGVIGSVSLAVFAADAAVVAPGGPSGTPNGTCGLCVLAPSGQSLQLTGNGSLSVSKANVVVNSTSEPAVSLTGNGSLLAPSVDLAGTASETGKGAISNLVTGIAPIADPLAGLPVPSLPVPSPPPSVTVNNGSRAISPGVYREIAVNGNSNLTLEPGTYVVLHRFTGTGSANITGQGVTIYLACSAYPTPCAPGEQGASFSLTGNGALSLSGPKENCSPVAIFADRNSTAALTLTGGAAQTLDGMIYAKSGALTLTGNSSIVINGLVVVGTTTLTGNGNVSITDGVPLSEGLALSLSASSLSPRLGETETLSASLTCNGRALKGQPVTFTTTGANPNHGSANTNPEGSAALSYRGLATGADTAEATFSAPGIGVAATPVTINWAKALPSISTAVSAGSVDLGTAVSDTAKVAAGFAPTGKVSWNIYAASDTACKTPLNSEPLTAPLSGGLASSPGFKPTAAGTYQFLATYGGDADNKAVSTSCGDKSEQVTVAKALPSISTAVSAASVELGSAVGDTAKVTSGLSPTGKVSWNVYAASDTACKAPLNSEPLTAPLSGGSASSPGFTPSEAGTYQFVATYGGDANNEVVSTKCGDTAERVAVTGGRGFDPASTSAVQGNFYTAQPSATSFTATPEDTPAFGESFPTIDFNPPRGTVIGEPIAGPNPSTRPFSDVTTDVIGSYAGTVIAQGNGDQAGVGALESFDAAFTSTIVVAQAGDITFNILHDDGFMLGIGGGATRVSGANENPPESNVSPFEKYQLVGAFNETTPLGPRTDAVTVHFPKAGTYPYELDYFKAAGSELTLTMTVASFAQTKEPLATYVGYADGLRPAGKIFPFPWKGSPGVTFVGSGTFDSGAIRFHNDSSAPITLESVTVDVGANHFDIWPKNLMVPADEELILAQDSGENLDTSDFSGSPCGVDNGVIPKVNVTVAGKTKTYSDTQQVLNTDGFDRACEGNESHAWELVGGEEGTAVNKPLPPAMSLLLSPAQVGPDVVGQAQSFRVAAMNGEGKPVRDLPITLHVNGGATGKANNQILTATTDTSGSATFAYTGRGAETDAISATAFNQGLQEVSNTASLQWNIPVPGGAPSGGTPAQAPPAISVTAPAPDAVLGTTTPVTATITPPASETISNWKALYKSTASGASAVTIGSGTGTPPATLAKFEPMLLPNGGYTITVEATASGGGTGLASEAVSVLDESKLGRYVTTYDDLSVPLNGTEVAVQRTYDSTDKSVGDFGVGWRLGLSDFKVSTNGPLGAGGWSAAPSECSLFGCTYAFHSSVPHTVTVTEPGGQEEVFNYTPSGGFGPFFFLGTSAFTPQSGTRPLGTLSDFNIGAPVYDFAGNLDAGLGGSVYEPSEFIFTANNGAKYLISVTGGLLDELSPNGDCLNLGAEAVTAYTGVSAGNIAGCSGGVKAPQQLTFSRDSEDRITKIVEPDGTTTITYGYDPAGDLTTVTYPSGEKDIYTYDAKHDLLSAKGPGRPTLKETYSVAGRLESITDGDGNTIKVNADPEAMTQTLESPDAKLLTVMSYDAHGNLVREERAGEGTTRTTTWTYDSNGDVTSKTDPLGHTSKAEYDATGDLLSYTDADGHANKFTYNSMGKQLSRTDPLANITKETYNPNGELTGLTEPTGGKASFTYDPAGDVTERTNPLGSATHYKYNASHELEQVILPSGHATKLAHNSDGEVTSSTDALGNLTEFEYDPHGRITTVKNPLGAKTNASYNAEGLLESSTDAAGHMTKYTYDPAGHLTEITDALGGTVKMTYDKDGQLETLTDPDGRTRTYKYDAFGELIGESSPATGTTKYVYDADGRLISSANALGQVVTRKYDPAGNVIELVTPESTITYTYDADGRLTKMVDHTGTTGYAYNPDGRLVKTTTPEGAFEYTYTDGLQRSALAANGMKPIEYRYNTDGDLVELIDPEGNATKFEYDAGDRLVAVVDPNGQTTSYEYDGAGQRKAVRSSGHAKAPLRSFEYQRDANGDVTTLAASLGTAPAVTTTDRYDALNRLKEEETEGHTTTYEYDAGGNATKVGEVSYSYSAGSGLLSAIGGQAVEHDETGQVTKLGSSTFGWDALGDMTSASVAGKTTSYSYNGDGVRVGAGGANSGSYLWNNGELLSDGKNLYLGGPAGAVGQEPLAGGAPAYYTPDALGSVTGTSNASGELASSSSYRPDGAPISQSGTQPALGFTGALQDSTGLPYLRSRELDPEAGAFLSADAVQPNGPSTLGYNLFAYAEDNPTTLTDPSGHGAAEYVGLEGGLNAEAFNALYGKACKFNKDTAAACLQNCKSIFNCLVQGGAASTFFPSVLRTFCVTATVLNNLASIASLPAGAPLPANEAETPLGHSTQPNCRGEHHRGVPSAPNSGGPGGSPEAPPTSPPQEGAGAREGASGPSSGESEGEEEEEEEGEGLEVEIAPGPIRALPCPRGSRIALRAIPSSTGYLRAYRCR